MDAKRRWLREQAARLDLGQMSVQPLEVHEHPGSASSFHSCPSAAEELDRVRKSSVQPAGFNPTRHVRFIRGRPTVVFFGGHIGLIKQTCFLGGY
jgi:hypothetical protein